MFELESNVGTEDINEFIGGFYFHPVLDTRNKTTDDFLNLIQYFSLIIDFLKLILDIWNIKKNMHFWGRYDFSNSYLQYMLESGHLISWSIFKNIFEYYPTLDLFFLWYRHFERCVWFFVWVYLISSTFFFFFFS